MPQCHMCANKSSICALYISIATMNIVVLVLPIGQSLSTDKWPFHMEVPLVCTIHGARLIIHIMLLQPFRFFAIPNKHIRRKLLSNKNDAQNLAANIEYMRTCSHEYLMPS